MESTQEMFNSINSNPEYSQISKSEECEIIRSNPRATWEGLLVQHHLRLPLKLIQRYEGKLDTDDLYQDCVLALIDASKSFDETKGLRFSTHAYWQIRDAVSKARRRALRGCEQSIHGSEVVESLDGLQCPYIEDEVTLKFSGDADVMYQEYYVLRKTIQDVMKDNGWSRKYFDVTLDELKSQYVESL